MIRFFDESFDEAYHTYVSIDITQNKGRMGWSNDLLETNKVKRTEKKGRFHVVDTTTYYTFEA